MAASLGSIRLQPRFHTVAASVPYGCSLDNIRLQAASKAPSGKATPTPSAAAAEGEEGEEGGEPPLPKVC